MVGSDLVLVVVGSDLVLAVAGSDLVLAVVGSDLVLAVVLFSGMSWYDFPSESETETVMVVRA